ncbi:MAG TPA: hypothetical protein VE891_10380 [Allosphingosinicella sp.]|nr:hypothetical protein [Allosphingosinicella sp.]
MPKLSFASARAFDSGLAALAALSAGFVAFAMPESLFSGLVETSRLPDFVPAAQPPLGETARLAATGAAALLTFAAVWGLMALLGRTPARRKPEAETGAEAGAEAPKLRRADAHPDAPARRPLLARDLGEPLDLEDFEQAPAEEELLSAEQEQEQRPLPAFLVAQEPEPEPAETQAPWNEPQPEWTAAEPQWAEAEPERVDAQPQLGPEPEPEPEAEPEVELRPEPRTEARPIAELAARLPEAEEEESDQSLSQMVNRIEFGLRKRQALPGAIELPPVEDAPAEPEKVGHRLRSAINDLQKIASTGG